MKDESAQTQAPFIPSGAPIASVTIHQGPGAGQNVLLRRVASLFGAKRGCKFVLRDSGVARRHCVIVNTGYRVILRDLATEGRTLRNGLRAEHEFLDDGDELKIGQWVFKIGISEPEVQSGQDSPVIVDLEPDPSILAIEDTETRHIGKLPREVSTLGRSPNADFSIDDREISRIHAVVFMYLSRPVIFDCSSENGTLVNGQRCVFAKLKDGDEIELGSRKLRFRSSTPSPTRKLAVGNNKVLKPTPFDSPEGTLSDLIDLSAESRAS